jgi:hypothetical protein
MFCCSITTESIAVSATKLCYQCSTTVLGNTSNTNTGDQNNHGNAGTATALATVRTINGVPFDGTAILR